MIHKTFYMILLSLILFTPFIYSNELFDGITITKQLWFYSTMAFLLPGFGIDILLIRKNVSFNFNIIDYALIVFYIYFFIRATFTRFTPLVFNTRFLNYTLLLLFYFVMKILISMPSSFTESKLTLKIDDKANKTTNISVEIIIHILMLTGLGQAILGFFQLYGVLPSFHSGFKITGTFFNPAPYALYLAAIFPMALGKLILIKESPNEKIKSLDNSVLKHIGVSSVYSDKIQFFHSLNSTFLINKISSCISILTVVSIILILPATMNRASWLGATIGSVIVFNYRYNLFSVAKRHLNSTVRKFCVITFIILIICILGRGLYLLKKGSSDGRLLIWEVTIGKIAKSPLFGYGVGRFQAEYNNWQAEYFKTHPQEMDGTKGMVAGDTKYCFNEYLEMGSEAGIIGLLLFLCVIASLFISFRKRILIPYNLRITNDNQPMTNDYNFSIPIFLISSWISLLVCALISFPFYSLPTLIIFFLLLALISSYSTKNILIIKLADPSIIQRFTNVLAALFLFLISVFLIFLITHQRKDYYIFDEAVKLYQTNSYKEACKSFSTDCSSLQYNGTYLQYYGLALYLNKEYTNSRTILERAAKFNANDIFYCNLGDSYKACEMNREAEETYRFASFMVPHKLYPLYLLAMLYEETGQKEKAIDVAKRILGKEIKVKSDATEEIKIEMRKIIEREK